MFFKKGALNKNSKENKCAGAFFSESFRPYRTAYKIENTISQNLQNLIQNLLANAFLISKFCEKICYTDFPLHSRTFGKYFALGLFWKHFSSEISY